MNKDKGRRNGINVENKLFKETIRSKQRQTWWKHLTCIFLLKYGERFQNPVALFTIRLTKLCTCDLLNKPLLPSLHSVVLMGEFTLKFCIYFPLIAALFLDNMSSLYNVCFNLQLPVKWPKLFLGCSKFKVVLFWFGFFCNRSWHIYDV